MPNIPLCIVTIQRTPRPESSTTPPHGLCPGMARNAIAQKDIELAYRKRLSAIRSERAKYCGARSSMRRGFRPVAVAVLCRKTPFALLRVPAPG
jgi:hypothetical protein